MNEIYNEIFDYVSKLEIIDSHEHLPYKEDARDKNTDILKEYLTHYFNKDLISAGLSTSDLETVINPNISLSKRWNIVEPYWNMSRHTGYGRALDISVKALYGKKEINGDTIEEINNSFLKTLKKGHFKKVLKDMSNIKISLLDSDLDCDKEFFRSVYRLDKFIYPRNLAEIKEIEKETEISICSLEDWLEACEMLMDKAFDRGAVALKCGLAYDRTLFFDKVTFNDAEEAFNEILSTRNFPDWENNPIVPKKAFQDYMMHYILRLANKRKLTYQFHTGLQEGNGNYITNSDPSLMTNLFLEYPNVKFDIFHIGYPYQHVLSALAKNFPNVYIDMCWAHIISPKACVQSLEEWIDSVPVNKIIAFGGDYILIDAVYGHQYLARVNVSKALTKKVEDGVFDVNRACEIAKLMFYDNPMKLYNLEGKI